MTVDYPWNGLLGELVVQRMYGVEFVLDYVVLKFDNDRNAKFPTLQCFVDPEIIVGGKRYVSTDVVWAHLLRSLAGQMVVATAGAPDSGLRIELESAEVVLLPTASELVGPEIAVMHGESGWMVWRPGEEAFEYLG